MTKLEELNQRLAEIYTEAVAAGIPVNTDGEEGCPPCNTIPDDDSCVGCPYRLRDLGWENIGER